MSCSCTYTEWLQQGMKLTISLSCTRLRLLVGILLMGGVLVCLSLNAAAMSPPITKTGSAGWVLDKVKVPSIRSFTAFRCASCDFTQPPTGSQRQQIHSAKHGEIGSKRLSLIAHSPIACQTARTSSKATLPFMPAHTDSAMEYVETSMEVILCGLVYDVIRIKLGNCSWCTGCGKYQQVVDSEVDCTKTTRRNDDNTTR
jgi:hypothetical protein